MVYKVEVEVERSMMNDRVRGGDERGKEKGKEG
jgi:hypothetical protein